MTLGLAENVPLSSVCVRLCVRVCVKEDDSGHLRSSSGTLVITKLNTQPFNSSQGLLF